MKNLIVLIVLSYASMIFGQTEEQMMAWQKYMTPSDTHLFLAKAAGKWKGETKMWESPDKEPLISVGNMMVGMMYENRYQNSTFTGEFAGMPFNGNSITAYDNALEEFIVTWIDNFGTGMMVLRGKWVTFGKEIELKGTMVDPMSGKELKVREVLLFPDETHQIMKMYYEVEGVEFQSMEISYVRL